MKFAIAQMIRQEPRPSGDRGWIVNISSIGGVVGLSMERTLPLFASLFLLISSLPSTAPELTSADMVKRPTARAKGQWRT
jgi:hypothetical protein